VKITLTILLAVFVIGAGVLAAHVYLATRSHVHDGSLTLARIDLHQHIDRPDAERITAWLYRQKGVNHVMVNPQRAVALFTFMPAMNNANSIVRAFKDSLPYDKAERYLPTRERMSSGCPVIH
jgi:hypothetical protein